MLIVETSVFTRQLGKLLEDNQYRSLQEALSLRPEMGTLIPGGGGLRKIRWSIAGRGKRGGVRIIYYWAAKSETILMLFIYPKNKKDDLTSQELKTLRQIIKEGYHE